MLYARQHLGDYIDQTDPCTANPNDPICQATAQDVAQDPCKLNPNASYCQGAIITQSASSPKPDVDTSQWAQFWESTPTATHAQAANAPAGALSPALATVLPKNISWKALGVVALLGGATYWYWRRNKSKS